jgi:radial spoke head protein 4A
MSTQDQLFQQVKAYLLQADHEGRSAYDHLESVIRSILEENPDDIASHPEKLNELSALIKANSFTYGQPSSGANAPAPLHSTQAARFSENIGLFIKPPPEVVTTIEQPTPYTTVTTTTVKPRTAPSFKSVTSQNASWRQFGAALPETEAFLIDQSITKLATEKGLDEVRFVGKIFGTRGNYLVVSSKRFVAESEQVFVETNDMPKPPRKKTEVPIQPEPGFKGVNRLSFWVASHAADAWTLLPDVTPQQINAARKIRKYFTGDLAAPVISCPAFGWNEAVLLRAQLSRIVSATFISPANALEKVEPEEEEEPEGEEDEGKKNGPKPAKYTPLTRVSKEYAPDEEAGVAPLLDLEQWVHSEGYIYETGRQTKLPDKPEVEGEEEEAKEEEEEEGEGEEKKEEEEKDVFVPIKKDYLYAVINLPKEPTGEEGEEEEAEAEPEEGEGEDKEEEEENKPLDDEEIPDDDPLKKKLTAWTARITNTTYKKHATVVVKSVRWPGAFAYASKGAKDWGCVYFGNGTKKTDQAFAPLQPPPVQKEVADIVEVMDPTAATEKLVLRGEEPKEQDSEDEKDEEEPEEEA